MGLAWPEAEAGVQGNDVVAAMAEVFQAFREQEDARQAQQAQLEHPLLTVDPTALREALSKAGGQVQGACLRSQLQSCMRLSSGVHCFPLQAFGPSESCPGSVAVCAGP